MEPNPFIQPIHEVAALAECARIVRESFFTVAGELGLTPENAPTNPAFITAEKLNEAYARGVIMFGMFRGEEQVGFFALEAAGEGVYYLERLAVLPGYRHRGWGTRLIDYAFDYVRKAGGVRISIAVVHENAILKQWYYAYGFRESGRKTFPHLPFTVCFMEKLVSDRS
jgi:ribosomal protein S18 acetylase RimI-like enzyme